MLPQTLFFWLDFLGVFVGALGGAIEATRNRRFDFDVIGVIGLALASALGGGMTRDVLLGRGAPLALVDVRYLAVALAGAVVGLIFHSRLGRRTELMLNVVDAAALGLFAVAGSTRALHAGLNPLPALLLGVITAAGGGAWRDVLSGCAPRVFVRGQLYVIAAAAAAALFLAAQIAGIESTAATALGTATGFALRLLALHFNWQTQGVRATGPPVEEPVTQNESKGVRS